MGRLRVATKFTDADAAVIKGMVGRGDRQMDVAVWAGCNQARVCEIARGVRLGARFKHVNPAPASELPPVGPYTIVPLSDAQRHHAIVSVQREALEQLRAIVRRLEHELDIPNCSAEATGSNHNAN